MRPARPLRVYDPRGQERFVRAGQTVPAGWFRDGRPPVELAEEALVVARIDEGNPYDQDSEDSEYLVLETANDRLRAVQAAAIEQAGQAEAARLNSIAVAAGLRPGEYGPLVSYSGYLCGEKPYLRVNRQAVTEISLRAMLPELLARQERNDAAKAASALQARRETAIKDFAAAAGMTCGKMVRWQGAYVSHEDSFGGLGGGDYDSGESWEWEEWAQEILTAPGDAAEITAACAAWKTDKDAADQLEREARAREISIRIAAEKLAKQAELLAAGLRAEEAARAMESAAEEARLCDIARIRRDWRTINSQSWRARSARNGGRSGYHSDALALMDRIELAQRRAMELRRLREDRERAADCERRTRAEKAASEAADRQKQAFIGNTWSSALDGLKF